jgi:hypothetical protein
MSADAGAQAQQRRTPSVLGAVGTTSPAQLNTSDSVMMHAMQIRNDVRYRTLSLGLLDLLASIRRCAVNVVSLFDVATELKILHVCTHKQAHH